MNNLPLSKQSGFIPLGDPRLAEIVAAGLTRIAPDIVRDIASRRRELSVVVAEQESTALELNGKSQFCNTNIHSSVKVAGS